VANALPQALVLTAIVIGFGLFAFALTLVFRAYTSLGTLDSDEMRVAEPRGGREMSWISPPRSSSPSLTAVAAFLMRDGPSGAGSRRRLGWRCCWRARVLLMARCCATASSPAQMGGWPAPFGITLVADLLSAVMVVITGSPAWRSRLALAKSTRKGALGYHALFRC
jgi:hypothetical protein